MILSGLLAPLTRIDVFNSESVTSLLWSTSWIQADSIVIRLSPLAKGESRDRVAIRSRRSVALKNDVAGIGGGGTAARLACSPTFVQFMLAMPRTPDYGRLTLLRIRPSPPYSPEPHHHGPPALGTSPRRCSRSHSHTGFGRVQY